MTQTPATTPSLVTTTPSFAHGAYLRQPLESPCPPDPAGAARLCAPAPALAPRYRREIETVFKIFDPDLEGHLDAATFAAMARSLGFRLSRADIEGMVEAPQEEVGEAGRRVDLALAIRILAQSGYATRSPEEELRMYFCILGGNKGHITSDDLKRVQNEVKEAERELDIGGAATAAAAIGDASLQAMIDQFDLNRDGVVDEEEFKKVLAPFLSSASP